MTVPLGTLLDLGLLPERCTDCDSRRCLDFACRAQCQHGLRADLCAGPGHYPADSDGPAATMRDAAGQYHAQGLPCPYDCAACDLSIGYEGYSEREYLEATEPEPVYLVHTPYGTLPCLTRAEAADKAREAARITGRACKVVKV